MHIALTVLLMCSATASAAEGVVHAVDAQTLRSDVNRGVVEGRWLIDLQLVNKVGVLPNAKNFVPHWQNNTKKRSQIVRLSLTKPQFSKAMILQEDRGYRLLKQFPYRSVDNTWRTAAIWIEHDTQRSRFSSAIEYEKNIENFLKEHRGTRLSVTAYRRHNRVFTRAFTADMRCLHCVPLASTEAFELGDVSQAMAGILAAKLEHRQENPDGEPINLSLNWKTSDLLILLPDQHQHRPVDLLSHTSCVSDSEIDFLDQPRHAPSSFYLEQIWDAPLVPGCAAGLLEHKSTLGFIYLTAFLEAATGRSVSELIEEELAQPLKIASLKAMKRNKPNTLGDGLVSSSAGVAKLVASVLKGDIVPMHVSRNRIWNPESQHNNFSFGWRMDGRNQVSASHHDGDKQAKVIVDRRNGNILVVLLDGYASRDAFIALVRSLLQLL